jgi:hypothetical protein
LDFNNMLRRNQLSLMAGDRSMSPREKRAHAQFAREYSDQIARTCEAHGADLSTQTGRALPGSAA